MKTIETSLYSYAELSDAARSRVIENTRTGIETDPDALQFIYDEMNASVKAIADACGLTVLDYAWGPSCRNHKLSVSGHEEDLSGPRALAWFLRILVNHGYTRPKRFSDMEFPGVCGFTETSYDDTIAETVWKALRDGETVRTAFDSVSYEFNKVSEAELEYQLSDAAILETLDESAEIYTEDGETF